MIVHVEKAYHLVASNEVVDGAGARAKPKRPEYKFHKKPVRTKGKRGKADDSATYDGSAMRTGKHGGLVRVS